MNRYALPVALAAIITLPVLAVQTPAQEQEPAVPVFGARAEMVQLSVTVTDARGRSVTDLTQDDFFLIEDGRPQEIRNFYGIKDQTEVGIGVGLVLDVSGSMSPDQIGAMRVAIDQMLTNMKRDDEYYVMEFAMAPILTLEWTNNKGRVLNTVRQIKTRMGTAIYDAILEALPVSTKGSKKKQVMVVMTDGQDYNSKSNRSMVAEAARASDVIVYAIVMDGEELAGRMRFGQGRNFNLRQQAAELAQVTDPTGGSTHYVQGFQQLEAILNNLGKEVTQQYFLEYQSDNPARDGKFRQINVATTRENVTVKHRNGYVAD